MSRYKSYKDAMVLGSKGNSTAGCSSEQIAANKTSLLMIQRKRCPCFDAFDEVFSSTPNVKPVHPLEVGAMEDGDDPDSQQSGDIPPFDSRLDFDLHDRPRDPPSPPAFILAPPSGAPPPERAPPPPRPAQVLPSRPSTAAAVAPPPAAGRPAAVFHLAPSKKEKKMDLGEAYLKAQQSRIDSQAASAQAKNRVDFLIALSLQGKTAVEISDFVALLDEVKTVYATP